MNTLEGISGLRMIGFAVGMAGLLLTFVIHRGPRWQKKNFVLFGLFSLGVMVVSLNPDILNAVAETLRLEMSERGRVLTLLIGSNIILWFSVLFMKTKLDRQSYQFDHLIRNLGYKDAEEHLAQTIESKEVIIIIPAYNEEENLKELLRQIPATMHGKSVGVLVVDDGSSDNTCDIVKQSGHMVVKNKINRGQGAASRLGYDVLKRHNIEIGVTMDADLQHDPKDAEKLVGAILDGHYDLVIGARKKSDYTGSLLRKAGLFIFGSLINMLAGLKLTDCSSGLKAFRIDKMKRLELREDQFQSAEVILMAAKSGLKIGEVPISIRHRVHGTTKKGGDWTYGLNFARAILKSWWR